MTSFNLSSWALRNQALMLYSIILFAIVGIWSYRGLGQAEDPPFTFKVMVVQTQWPGATALEISEKVTETIEKKLQEIPELDYLRSYSRPGESQVFFVVKDSIDPTRVPDVWYQVRKKVGDVRYTLPPDIRGPFFNDEFGDTFGNIYALSGEGFDDEDLRDYAERVKLELLRVPNVAKIELIGRQEPKIYVEASNAKLATLGVSFAELQQTLASQNAVVPGGSFETASDRIYLRTTGALDSVEAIRDLSIRGSNGRLFRLGDIADVRRGFIDPPQPRMRFKGSEAIGIAVSMRSGGDIIALGHDLEAATTRIGKTLPLGLDLHKVADQPAAVSRSIGEFVRTLGEAVLIVLLVSFFSLGLRSGFVVAVSIPLVLAMTFAAMNYFGIGLHKISLGALVLGLGLLVDDAIIAVEMMAIKMEQGMDRVSAAAFAYTSTAFPMLTGTLVTAAGFLPIATAKSGTGEYTRAIFEVVTISLLLSWIAAVVFIPYLGYKLLPDPNHAPRALPSSALGKRVEAVRRRLPAWFGGIAERPADGSHDPYASPFYRRFRALVGACVEHRYIVIGTTVLIFGLAIFGFRFVQQQFFPDSTRPELLIDLKLSEGSSLNATKAQVEKLEAWLAKRAELENYVSYVGSGSPRFYLPLDQQLPQAGFAQFVLLTHGKVERENLRDDLLRLFEVDFPELRARVIRLENGPPVGYPLQYRISGPDIQTARALARKVADVVRTNANARNVNLDWEEPSKVIRLAIDQDRARVLGVSSEDVANFMQSSLNGVPIATYRERDQLIGVLLRGPADERARMSLLQSLSVPTASGRSVPLGHIATIQYEFEEGIIWRRGRLPTVTVRADIEGTLQPATVDAQISPTLAKIRADLPEGYRLETGGSVEESAKGQGSVNAGFPLFLGVVVTVLMLQLRSFQRVLLVVLTAPLGLIGVVLFLLVFRVPFGFVAMLGTIAMFGMIMRNSVILVDQIEHDIGAGHRPWDAIVDATVRRFRPIVLTAAAAILAMIPLSRSAFFGPMAVAIMGGLTVATALTLLFLPALYAAWFRIHRDTPAVELAPELQTVH
ncbi:efflux RND transporter permease subunit [Dokdonella sp.]|uniref:efflux RND transporter permease subunit n=1 Tax=Dokdonella sp. TaxID=2291710 RepID=UPI002C06DD86|nr:efflux RND transporter permease subunit [Dokdonella sp.]HOX70523.1 efflux RND transporter permease subunit [Dokdonella sp.]HPN78260.1 efflux RND transporter permease subunit [Dokdonella sp.]